MRHTLLAFLLCLPLVAQAVTPNAPRTTRIVQSTGAGANAAVFDGTKPVTLTPTNDLKLTVTQDGATTKVFPNAGVLTITQLGNWPPKGCGIKPPVATRSVQCPAGSTGTWTQTQDWQCAGSTWQVLPWAPTVAPAGTCVANPPPPPPTNDISLAYVDKTSSAYATYKGWVDANLNRTDGYLFLATDAAYMAKLDGGTQYCAKAITMADAYATKVNAAIAAGGQPNWGADANGSDGISSDSYLNVGGHLRDFALTIKWCQPSPAQVSAWTAITTQAVYNVWNPTQAKWGGRSYPWSGWSITDPGDNYFYSFTLATMMYQWVTGDAQYATRTWPLAQAYFATLPTGGSEEGTGYGTSHKGFFEDIRFERDLFGQSFVDDHLTNSIYYWLHATTPDFLHFAAIGDQSRVSEPTWYDYQRALVAQAMTLTPDAAAKAQGSWLLHHVTPASMQYSFDYRDGLLPAGDGGTAPTALSYFASSTGDLFVRTGWDTHALWAAFRAGKYDQSHAHQDQGSFTLYQNGWLAVDESIWSHSGIEQGVTNNNTLRFVHNGAVTAQAYNSTSTMTVTGTDPSNGGVHAVADLKPAVPSAVSAWTRKFDFVGNTVTITDAYTANAGYAGIWQASLPVQPIISGKTAVAGGLTITVLSPVDAVLTAADWTTVSVPGYGLDYTKGWRLDVSSATNTGYTVQLGATP